MLIYDLLWAVLMRGEAGPSRFRFPLFKPQLKKPKELKFLISHLDSGDIC